MNANEYQNEAARTLIDNEDVPTFPARDMAVAWSLVEMAQVLGEEIDRVKKAVFHEHGYEQGARLGTTVALARLAVMGRHTVQLLGTDPDPSRLTDAAGLSAFEIRMLWNTMGVLGEGAEIADVTLNMLSGNGYNAAALGKEIGDCCWYLAALCTMLDLDLGDVLSANIAKLRQRYPQGWNKEQSIHRVEAK